MKYTSDNKSITVKSQDDAITAEASSAIDRYKLTSTGTASPGTAAITDKDENMVISNLVAGTVHSLKFRALITCDDGPTPSEKESEEDSEAYIACTGWFFVSHMLTLKTTHISRMIGACNIILMIRFSPPRFSCFSSQ